MLIRSNGQKPHTILLYPKTGMDLGSTVAPPHALLTVAAPMLKAGYTVKLLDQRVEPITEEILRGHVSSDLLAVGISTMSGTQVAFALMLAKMVRKVAPNVPIVWGGCHPTVTPEQTLSHPLVDIVAIGEGDDTMRDIVDALGAHRSLCHVRGILYQDGSQVVKTLPRPLLNVEELLPTPWELVDVERYCHVDMYLRDRHRVLDIGQTSRGCPFDCVSGDMLLATSDGVFYPTEMVDPRRVVCSEGHFHTAGQLGSNPIASKGVQECVAIHLHNGLILEVTPGHKVMAVEDDRPHWVEAGSLIVNQYVALETGQNAVTNLVPLPPPPERRKIKRVVRTPTVLNEDVAWLSGFLIGDGYIPKNDLPLVNFCVTDETEPEARRRLTACFGYSGIIVHYTQTTACRQLVVSSRTVRDFFVHVVGLSPQDKFHVPALIRQSPKSVVAAFLDGLWTADGYWSSRAGHPLLATKSETLAREVAAVAAWIGLAATVSWANAAKVYYVGLCHDGCGEQWNVRRRCQASVIPMTKRIRRLKDGRLAWWKRRQNFSTRYRGVSGVSRVFLKELEPNHPLLAHRAYARIVKIESMGAKPVYDLSVCPTHQFSAACAIVHNCAFCSSASIRERKWRAQSVDRVMDDLQKAIRDFRLDGWWWRDDEWHIKRKRSNEICERIVQAGINGSFYTSGTRCDVFGRCTEDEAALLKRAGAHTLKFGAESGSQRILDVMQKGITVEQTLEANQKCRRHGITPAFSLMIGYPTETFEEMNQTIDLGYRLKRENPRAELETMCQYTALPGTPDWHLALRHGLVPPASLEEWANWSFDDFDLEGRKSPWYTRKERRYLGNISYSSILANSLDNAVTSIRNPWVRVPAQAIVKPAARYFKWRLSTHRYRWMPELEIVRLLRERIFYRSVKTIS